MALTTPGPFQETATSSPDPGPASGEGEASVYVENLRAERAECLQYGKHDRVAAVDAELRRLGAAPPPSAPAPVQVETATATTPVRRRSR